ncbi:MAG: NAD-dependent epimerase/dehydratase family protein, partial [Actinomycetota bacterium]
MRILLAGGAGFIGSHLSDELVARGDSVICVDNLSTGRAQNIEHLIGHRSFSFLEADVTLPLSDWAPSSERFDAVLDFASPASPSDFATMPLEILA